jgi:predicted nucleic acid-binding protein
MKELLKVKGTLGVVADAAKANLLDFVETVEQLQRTSMHLDHDVVEEVIREHRRSQEQG